MKNLTIKLHAVAELQILLLHEKFQASRIEKPDITLFIGHIGYFTENTFISVEVFDVPMSQIGRIEFVELRAKLLRSMAL